MILDEDAPGMTLIGCPDAGACARVRLRGYKKGEEQWGECHACSVEWRAPVPPSSFVFALGMR